MAYSESFHRDDSHETKGRPQAGAAPLASQPAGRIILKNAEPKSMLFYGSGVAGRIATPYHGGVYRHRCIAGLGSRNDDHRRWYDSWSSRRRWWYTRLRSLNRQARRCCCGH